MLQSYAEKRERFNIAFCCQLLLARDEVTRDLKDKKNVLWKKKKQYFILLRGRDSERLSVPIKFSYFPLSCKMR